MSSETAQSLGGARYLDSTCPGQSYWFWSNELKAVKTLKYDRLYSRSFVFPLPIFFFFSSLYVFYFFLPKKNNLAREPGCWLLRLSEFGGSLCDAVTLTDSGIPISDYCISTAREKVGAGGGPADKHQSQIEVTLLNQSNRSINHLGGGD